MKLPRDLPKPVFVRPNDFVSVAGVEFIVKRNEFQQMIEVVGRVSRKLPSEKDVIWALRSQRRVGCWGHKYFIFDRIDEEIVDDIKEQIWEADKRRGIPKPDLKAGLGLYE